MRYYAFRKDNNPMKKTVCCIIALLLAISLFGCGTEGYTDRVIKGKSAYVTLRMSKVSSSGKPFSGDFFNNVADGCGRLVAKCDKLMSHVLCQEAQHRKCQRDR